MSEPASSAPTAPPTVEIFDDSDALAEAAARRFSQAARDAIADRGRFTVALAGGSTPEKTYRLLAQVEFAQEIDWNGVRIFFGDERFVPRDDDRSNFSLARRTLLAHVPIPPDHIFPVDTTLPTRDDAARAYEATLRDNFRGDYGDDTTADETPIFDLILLGLGDDGHTASLFPHLPTLTRTDTLVVATPPGTLPPPVDRVTFTFPVLNAAREILFLVAGAAKADALSDVLENHPAVADRPAVGVQPALGTLTFLLDRAAAQKLTNQPSSTGKTKETVQ